MAHIATRGTVAYPTPPSPHLHLLPFDDLAGLHMGPAPSRTGVVAPNIPSLALVDARVLDMTQSVLIGIVKGSREEIPETADIPHLYHVLTHHLLPQNMRTRQTHLLGSQGTAYSRHASRRERIPGQSLLHSNKFQGMATYPAADDLVKGLVANEGTFVSERCWVSAYRSF